jgi:sortase A
VTGLNFRRHALPAALSVVGLFCLTWVTYQSLAASAFKARHLERVAAEAAAPAAGATPLAAADMPPPVLGPDDGIGPDNVVGVLEIPRLGVSEVVAFGDEEETLDVAIGHLPDTPLPWVGGNSVVAAHRDTHFRELRNIKSGDLIRMKTRKGVFEYHVKDRLIVDPDDVWVMAPTKTRRLTLVTCYPFNYIGSAPHRFIVQADAVHAGAAPRAAR